MATSKSRRRQKAQANARSMRTLATGNGWYLTGGYHAADTKRDVWSGVGYPNEIDFDMHWNMQSRNGIARAGIMRIVDKCWQDYPEIKDGDEEREEGTQFEKEVKILIEKHHLFQRFRAADWRNRVGRYSAIIPIVKEPVSGITPDMPLERVNGIDALIKLYPVFESQVEASNETVTDFNSADFGNPKYYNFRDNLPGDRNPSSAAQVQLHPSRLYVLAEGADDGSIYGIPANEAGFNALLTMEKITGYSGEGIAKNAKQRTVYNVKDGQVANRISSDKELKQEFDDKVDSFDSGNSASLRLYGMDVQTLQATLADPLNPWTIALNEYCASIPAPTSEILGNQTGERSSTENQRGWAQTAMSRRENFLTPCLRGFLEHLIKVGVLSKPSTGKICIEWSDLMEPSTGEKLDSMKTMAEIEELRFKAGRGGPLFTDEEYRETGDFETDPEIMAQLDPMFTEAPDELDQTWDKNKILLTTTDVVEGKILADQNHRPFMASPVSAALVTYDAIKKMMRKK